MGEHVLHCGDGGCSELCRFDASWMRSSVTVDADDTAEYVTPDLDKR